MLAGEYFLVPSYDSILTSVVLVPSLADRRHVRGCRLSMKIVL